MITKVVRDGHREAAHRNRTPQHRPREARSRTRASPSISPDKKLFREALSKSRFLCGLEAEIRPGRVGDAWRNIPARWPDPGHAASTRSDRMKTENRSATLVRCRADVACANSTEPLGSSIDVPTALLVLLEIFVLLGGVIARYVFHHPIIWSDELASHAVPLAGDAGVCDRLAPGRAHAHDGLCRNAVAACARLALDVVATVAALTFLLLILPSAYDFAVDEIPVTTPALQISDAWRAARLPIGFALMIAHRPVAAARGRQLAAYRSAPPLPARPSSAVSSGCSRCLKISAI